ncbi:MAG: flagellar FliJ family protein [Alphaproteobacteria bacterium]|jgi:flagellar FliJ protein|nr:hypothetical protein [Thalassospira sp.]MCE2965187.1 flagellar FliJ family protein [Alphaproteobacteria bacterium]
MKSLSTLIRLNKFQLDEKKRALKELQELAQNLHSSLAQLKEEFDREQAIAKESFTAAQVFHQYKAAIEQRRATLLESINQVDDEILGITNEMTDLFQDLKRFEITESERTLTSKKSRDKKEERALDDQAIVRYRRQQGS